MRNQSHFFGSFTVTLSSLGFSEQAVKDLGESKLLRSPAS